MTDRLFFAGRASRLQGGETKQDHELSMFRNAGGSLMTAFLDEISSLQTSIADITDHVRTLSSLHTRSLNATDGSTSSELDAVVTETRNLTSSVKRRIQDLGNQTKDLAREGRINQRDTDLRRNQLSLVRSKFMEAIQEYQRVEQDFSAKSRDRAARQYKIVKPDATPEEIKQVTNGGANAQQIFAQATLNTRYEESRGAYREVQERQEEIQKIEKTLEELAQLFQDMSVLIQQQEETIIAIETTADDIEKNVTNGLEQTELAVNHARRARRNKIRCLWITVAVIVVIALIVGLAIGLKP